jgi:predicted dehydrogenase
MLKRTLYEAGVHLVDFVMALFGESPKSVMASMSTCGVREGETDAVAIATLEFSRGRLANIVQDRLCKGETQYFEVRAELSDVSLRASFGGRARVSAGLFRSTSPHMRIEYGVSGMAWRETGSRRQLLARNPKNPGMLATRYLFEKTFAAWSNGDDPPASAKDGRDVLEVIAACYHSAATGRRIDLDDRTRVQLRDMQLGAPTVAVA